MARAVLPAAVWAEAIAFAEGLFDELDRRTRGPDGVTRASWGEGEQAAHDLVAAAARDLGLTVSTDAAGNLFMTMAGRDAEAPAWFTGSHLDSVPCGGNFDGAAGVVAGLAALHAFRAHGLVPARNVTVLATRGEEGSSWFSGPHKSHFGGRAALGQLSAAEMDAARSVVDGRSLAQMIADAGFDPKGAAEAPSIRPEMAHGFVELHIEQGPVLDRRAVPVGIVSGIRGTRRARDARAEGAHAHSGAVPREYRRDALLAAAAFAGALEARWEDWLAQGRDMVATLGRFSTDPAQASLTKVPGLVTFTLDIRSEDEALLRDAEDFVVAAARDIGAQRGVAIDLGRIDRAAPATMSPDLRGRLRDLAAELGIPAIDLASGGGHDAANFALAGIPTAIIFVRNPNGSHHPDEDMPIADFGQGARLLAALLAD